MRALERFTKIMKAMKYTQLQVKYIPLHNQFTFNKTGVTYTLLQVFCIAALPFTFLTDKQKVGLV
jgi:hypothetical protein